MRLLTLFIVHCALFIAPAAQAQVTPDVEGLALGGEDIRVIVARVIQVALGFLGIIVFGLILYGGFAWMTSAGDEEKITKAKRILTNAVIGLVIVLSAFTITTFVLRSLQEATRGPGEVSITGTGNYGAAGSSSYFLARAITPSGEVPIRNVVARVEFNRSVDPESVTPASFQVRRISGPGGAVEAPVEGTRTVRGTTIEFRPASACPAPNESRRCFDADTWFRVNVELALRSRDGLGLTCSLSGLSSQIRCAGEFRASNLVDVEAPTVTVESPDAGAAVPVDSCVPVQARARDDAGVSMVEFFADGERIEPDGVAVPPADAPAPTDGLFEIPCFDTTDMPTPSTHTLRARAYDVDDNSANSRDVAVVVRAAHCFNGSQDAGETGMDCGGECGGCDGAPCTSSAQCAGSACVNGQCASPTMITSVSPGDGRVGTFVTVGGRAFGSTAGSVMFTPAVAASAPQACSGATTWADHYALVGVPEGAQSGPLSVARAGCSATDTMCRDSTDDERGPIVPTRSSPRVVPPSLSDGSFWVNDTGRPGLCSVSPGAGGWNIGVTLSGAQFGALSGQAGVSFSGVPASAANWGDTSAQSAVPPIAYGAAQVQISNAQGVVSNALQFNVESPDSGTLPHIFLTMPREGGPGQGITVAGRNFGETPGIVWFIAPDGQQVQADTSVPSQCGNAFWSPTSIRVKVPRVEDRNDRDGDGNRIETLNGAYQVYVRRYDSADSNREGFTMTNTPAGPFLACALPVSGPPLTNVTVFGERLGDRPAKDDGLFFTAQGATTGNSSSPSWISTRATATSTGGAPADPCPVGGWSSVEICAQVPTEAARGDLVVETTSQRVTRRSNPLQFTVGRCAGVPEAERISCGALSCCGDGSCNTVCLPTLGSQGAFGWTFSTAPAPLIPRVVEFCDTAAGVGHPTAPPSPAPWNRSMGEAVCINAALSVRFTTRVEDDTVRPNIKVEQCSAPENFIADPGFEGGAPDFDPGVVEPTHLSAARVLGIDRSGTGNYGLQLTKLDDDVGVGPGPPDAQGRHSNYEHWFGFEARVIADTDGTTYTASVWLKAGSPAAVGKRAGILIERSGGNFEKSSREVTLTERWTQVTVSHAFSDTEGAALPGFVRIFLQGLPNQGGAPNDPNHIFSVQADDVEVTADPCTESTLVETSVWSAPEIYLQDEVAEGFLWSPPEGAWQPDTWYRVTLLGGTGGIRAPGAQGQPMIVLDDAARRCGDARAAYCFRFKTRDSDEPCEVGGIAVSPNPWTARAQFEEVSYRAQPVAAQDPCITLSHAAYQWSWSSSDTSRAAVTFPGSLGHHCQSNPDNLDCLVGSCVNGTCASMSWTTTAVALNETDLNDPVEIRAATQNVEGEGTLHIAFQEPRVEAYWPSCGTACTNAAVGGRFNIAMNAATVVNPAHVQVWSASCGNGTVERGEDCDDGNNASGDGCSSVCLNEGSDYEFQCGNGVFNTFEDCDDGDLDSGDGCSARCLNEGSNVIYESTCGSGGAPQTGEDCDDGNTQSGDGCSNLCLHEGTRSDVPVCGNRRVDRGEECEASLDGTFTSWCDERTCLRQGTMVPLCGNGRIDPGEECDRTFAGNFAPNGLCDTSRCLWVGTLQPTRLGGAGCGNSTVELGEDCDDAGRAPGDGCSETCLNEGAVATEVPACGNSAIDVGEDCDDGNTTDGDGCSVRCLNEGTPTATCGNGTVERGEDCDRGLVSPTLCTEDCQSAGTSAPACGNGVRNDGEDCDDGNTTDGDGCSATCVNEGREAQRVMPIGVTYSGLDRTFALSIPTLAPSTFYRVILRGDDGSTAAREGIVAHTGKPLTELNFFYNWIGIEPPVARAPGIPNTFSWTFKTGETTCAVERVELAPEQAVLYVVGARQRYSSQPFGPPDACDAQGQRLNPVSYEWDWRTQEAAVATIVDAPGVNVIPSCGNGRLERGEDCDDGNTIGTDGCSAICLNEGSNFPLACGNFTAGPGEECDDGNNAPGDGCSPQCLNEGTKPPACGNGIGDPGEDCDDGNVVGGDVCSPRCLNEGSSPATTCGNAVVDDGEECDPAAPRTPVTFTFGIQTITNVPSPNNFCDPFTCLLRGTAPRAQCGNRTLERGEDCDDGNVLSGDGCSASCLHEGSVAARVVCGNGALERGEDCDDGNTASGDGCSSNCLHVGTVPDDRVDPEQDAQAQGFREPEQTRGFSTTEIEAEAEGKTGASPLTVYCVARDDTDCPYPRGQAGYTGEGSASVGRGAGNCCYPRPRVVARTPIGAGVCRNAQMQAVFSDSLDETNLVGNFRMATVLTDDETCPPGTVEIDAQGNPVSAAGAQTSRAGGLARLWSWLTGFVRKILPGAQAAGTRLCVAAGLTLAPAASTTEELSDTLTLKPSRLLDGNTRYRILIIGDRNLSDAVIEGVRSARGAGMAGVEGWDFETGSDVCTLDEVRIAVEGSTTLTQRGEQREVQAQAWSRRGGEQMIQTTAGYRWRWAWAEENAQVASVSNNPVPTQEGEGELALQTVTAGERNGTSTMTATATLYDDTITGGVCQAGVCSNDPERACTENADCARSVRGTEQFTTILCDNPWPQVNGEPIPYRDPSEPSMNFQTMYCRDRGRSGPEEDRPALEYPGAALVGGGLLGAEQGFMIAVVSGNSAQILKEFLLPVIHGKQPRDAIGIRVMTNPDRLDPLAWYRAQGFRGNPEVLTTPPDGFAAIRDGRTVYIGAPNAVARDQAEGVGFRIFSNIYIISYNEGAEAEVREIFDQMVANFIFNINIANPKVCEDGTTACSADIDCNVECLANKDKLRRDLARMNHFAAISEALRATKIRTGRFPTLEAGTFVRSLSTSRWPSWQATLGPALGIPPPTDPINRFAQGCDPPSYDPLTCWSERTQTYRCPSGSRIYQYRSVGGVEAQLSADFERIGSAGWEVPGWPPRPSNNGDVALGISGTCEWTTSNPLSTWSNAQGLCGNRIVETSGPQGAEQCEPPDTQESTVSIIPGLRCTGRPARTCTEAGGSCGADGVCRLFTSCTARRSCTTGCEWQPWLLAGEDPSADDCLAGGTFCGNGIVDEDEACDDGLLNGDYGKCNNSCTALGDHCGDGTPQPPEVCDEGEMNGNYGHCRFDCTGAGDRCGDGAVNEQEQCEAGQTQTLARRCHSPSTSPRFDQPCSGDRDCRRCLMADGTATDTLCGSTNDCPSGQTCSGGECGYCRPNATNAPFFYQATNDEQFLEPGHYPYQWRRSCTASCTWPPAFHWSCTPQGGCGNGIKEGSEQCDDGNMVNEDSCTNTCMNARCGDGFLHSATEECDQGAQNGVVCDARYMGTCTYCDSRCNFATVSGGVCGDNHMDAPDEQCDGTTLGNWICAGIVGQNEWFWHFASAQEFGDDFELLGSTPFTVVAENMSGGYLSSTAERISRTTVAGSEVVGFRTSEALLTGGGRSYKAGVWVNAFDSGAFGKRAGIGVMAGPSAPVTFTTITLDSNPSTWQYVEHRQTLPGSAYHLALILPDTNVQYAVYFDAMRVSQIQSPQSPQLPTASCDGMNCQVMCSQGGRPCNAAASPTVCTTLGQACTSNAQCGPAGFGSPTCTNNRDAPQTAYVAPYYGVSFFPMVSAWRTQNLTYWPTTVSQATDYRIIGDTVVDSCDNDKDNDGYPAGLPGQVGMDCDDRAPAVHPNAVEDCDDQVDNNCDGQVDNGCSNISLNISDTSSASGASAALATHCIYMDGTLVGFARKASNDPRSFAFNLGAGAHLLRILYHHHDNPSSNGNIPGAYQFTLAGAATVTDQSFYTSAGVPMGTTTAPEPRSGSLSNSSPYQGSLYRPAQKSDAVESRPSPPITTPAYICSNLNGTINAGVANAGSATYLIQVGGPIGSGASCMNNDDCTPPLVCDLNGICVDEGE